MFFENNYRNYGTTVIILTFFFQSYKMFCRLLRRWMKTGYLQIKEKEEGLNSGQLLGQIPGVRQQDVKGKIYCTTQFFWGIS